MLTERVSNAAGLVKPAADHDCWGAILAFNTDRSSCVRSYKGISTRSGAPAGDITPPCPGFAAIAGVDKTDNNVNPDIAAKTKQRESFVN
jgi:hypothetical protein